MYATRTRDHDALWYLQLTLVTNDMQVAAARRGKRTIAKHVEAVPPPPPSDSDEAAAAVRAVHRIGARMGLDDATRAELLEVLGLAEPAPKPSPSGIIVPARPSGTCRTCHRRGVYLRKDGSLSRHNRNPNLPASDSVCPGSLTMPRSETR